MNAFALLSFLAFGVNLAAAIYVFSRAPARNVNRLFFCMMLALAVWCFGEFLMRQAGGVQGAMTAGRIAGIGWCLVGGFYLLFVMEFTEHHAWIRNPWLIAACFAPGVMFLVFLWSTHLVFRGFKKSYWGFEELGGALRLPSKFYVAGLFIAGIVIVYRYWRRTPSPDKKTRAAFVLGASAVPVAVGLITDILLPAFSVFVPEMPVFASTIVGPVIGYAVVTQGLLTTVAGTLGGAVVTKMNDAVIVADPTGTIETVNPAAERLTGYACQDLEGKPLDRLFAEGTDPGARELAPEFAHSDWALCAGKEGMMIPVTLSTSNVSTKTGRQLGSVTVVHDMRETLGLIQAEHEVRLVTARVEAERDRSVRLRRTEEEVRQLTSFLEGVVGNIPDTIFIQDRERRYVYVNDAFCALTGYSREEILGKTDRDTYWGETATTLDDRLTRVFEFGEVVEITELELPDVQGKSHTTRSIIAPIRGESGEAEFVVGIVSDLTAQKELEQSRLDFIRIAAHELRTPLTSLKLSLELLTRETHGSLSEDEQRSLDVLSLSIERLSRLSRNLLDLATMDAGLMTLNLQPVDLGAVFAETRAVFERAAMEKGLEITCEVETSRPANADAARLSQVLYNLVSNAVKFTDEGGVRLACADEPSGEIRVSVSDTGCGIPHDKQEAVFSRFVKAQSAETAVEGTGLGLSIANAIVEAHGGRIKVRSEPGSGSVFTFTLKPWEEEG